MPQFTYANIQNTLLNEYKSTAVVAVGVCANEGCHVVVFNQACHASERSIHRC